MEEHKDKIVLLHLKGIGKDWPRVRCATANGEGSLPLAPVLDKLELSLSLNPRGIIIDENRSEGGTLLDLRHGAKNVASLL